MTLIKKIVRFLCSFGIIGFVTLLLFELVYRYSAIDFYASEYNSCNTLDLSDKSTDLLIFGDSFSAGDHTYVTCLRNNRPTNKIVNSAIQGIGLKQVNTFANRRIKEYKPKAILYQVYVGNDLTDLDHLSNYKTLSIPRNIYWGLSDWFLSISYINYKLGGLKSVMHSDEIKSVHNTSFATNNYNKRTVLKLKADADHIEKSVAIKEDFIPRFTMWVKEFEAFLSKTPDDTNVYVLFIPHCAQVNDFYEEHMKSLGANFSGQNNIQEIKYPFYQKAKIAFEKQPNVAFFNILDQFQKSDSIGHRIYYENDPHLNALGHQIVCDFINTTLHDLP